MIARLAALALSVLALTAPVQAQTTAAPSDAAGWRAAATRDLDAIRDIVRTDTPIGAGAAGPAYDAWLTQGYAEAQARLPQVEDRAGYFYTLAAYVNGFRDPHLSIQSTQGQIAPRWPGFIATRDGDGVVVSWRDDADAAAPAVGTRIVSCDGEAVDALAARNVLGFSLNPALPESRRRAAPRLFVDTGNPFAPAPRTCVFRTGASERALTLDWRPLPNPPTAFNAAYGEAGLGPAASFALTDVAPGVAWIGVPTFSQSAETGPQLSALMLQVQQRGAALRQGRAIVVDLRGNGGGNSDWTRRLNQVVFGDDVIRRVPYANPGGAAMWRASPGNLAYWRRYYDEMQRQVTSSTRVGAWSREVVQGMERAIARNEPLWRQGARDTPQGGGLTQRRPRGDMPFPARVYILSNGSCASSCLDFLDVALHVPGVQLIGAPSSADGVLADVRQEVLPSGQARFNFAQKVMLGAGRGSMEYYAADVPYDGPWSDAAVRAWVLRLIDQQSPPR